MTRISSLFQNVSYGNSHALLGIDRCSTRAFNVFTTNTPRLSPAHLQVDHTSFHCYTVTTPMSHPHSISQANSLMFTLLINTLVPSANWLSDGSKVCSDTEDYTAFCPCNMHTEVWSVPLCSTRTKICGMKLILWTSEFQFLDSQVDCLGRMKLYNINNYLTLLHRNIKTGSMGTTWAICWSPVSEKGWDSLIF